MCTTAQEAGSLGRASGAGENVSHPPCREGMGGVGTRLWQETQTLAPGWGAVHALPPGEVRTDSPRQQRIWWRGESPLLPSLHVQGEAQPPGAPSITHPSLVPFHSNQAAVMGLSPNLLPRAAAGRGSEPRTRLLRGVASLDSALCLRPTSGRPLEASSASLAGFLEEAARRPERPPIILAGQPWASSPPASRGRQGASLTTWTKAPGVRVPHPSL